MSLVLHLAPEPELKLLLKKQLTITPVLKTKDEVPRYAITMGIGTIMDAKELILLANKANKARVRQSSC